VLPKGYTTPKKLYEKEKKLLIQFSGIKIRRRTSDLCQVFQYLLCFFLIHDNGDYFYPKGYFAFPNRIWDKPEAAANAHPCALLHSDIPIQQIHLIDLLY